MFLGHPVFLQSGSIMDVLNYSILRLPISCQTHLPHLPYLTYLPACLWHFHLLPLRKNIFYHIELRNRKWSFSLLPLSALVQAKEKWPL